MCPLPRRVRPWRWIDPRTFLNGFIRAVSYVSPRAFAQKEPLYILFFSLKRMFWLGNAGGGLILCDITTLLAANWVSVPFEVKK